MTTEPCASIQKACDILQDLLDQLTLKDAPPSNDVSPLKEIENDSPLSQAASIDSTTFTTSRASEDVIDATRRSNNDRMGHTSLVELTNHALGDVQGHRTVPLQIETNTVLHASSPRTANPSLQAKKTSKLKFWKKKALPQTTIWEPRLQLFASEYARHLSTSKLAPSIRVVKQQRSKRTSYRQHLCIHDAAEAVQAGALVDICFTAQDEPTPSGFYRVGQTLNGYPVSFGKKALYLNVKKEVNWDKAAQRPCITAIVVVWPERGESIPPGFVALKDHACHGAYICFRRSREGNPITSLLPLSSAHGEGVPAQYTVVEKTPRGFAADLGNGLFLAYRQRLANLETLRPTPLMTTIEDDRLNAYFATGGTVVPADIGRFHIMDRSTHSLLSPSSVAHRLQLIQAMRRKHSDEHSTSSRHEGFEYSISDMASVSSSHHFREVFHATSFIPAVETVQSEPKVPLADRIAVLCPILTACYTRHGGSALVAVEGLSQLLTDTDFFGDDVADEDHESSTRLTLLDLAIQVVCDVVTTYAIEVTFPSCIDFVGSAVRYSRAQLNTRTIGYILRCYLFVFYFGTYRWPQMTWKGNLEGEQDDFPILLDPRSDTGSRSLPGGAPQLAAISFKELISLSMERLGKVSVHDMVLLSQSCSHESYSDSVPRENHVLCLIDDILSNVVDNAVDHVERANYTQLAWHQVHRSGGSELFWHDMLNTCGIGLFGKDNKLGEAGRHVYIMMFAVLANLVKVASGKTKAQTPLLHMNPRDVTCKMLSLELLLHFLECWSDSQEAVHSLDIASTKLPRLSIDTLGFCIRRLVVPCLLSNTRACLENPQVFRRVIRVVSELWCSPIYRMYCKEELGLLIEHFSIEILELGPQVKASVLFNDSSKKLSLLSQQLDVLEEVKAWFRGDPKDVIEMFFNFDRDASSDTIGLFKILSVSKQKRFKKLCSCLSSMAEACGEMLAFQILENHSKVWYHKIHESNLELGFESNSNLAVREAARALRRASLEALLQIVKNIAFCAAALTSNEYVCLLSSWSKNHVEVPSLLNDRIKTNGGSNETADESKTYRGDDDVKNYWEKLVTNNSDESVVASDFAEVISVAMNIAQDKNLKKAIEYMVACNAITPNPRDIVTFLRVHKDGFDPSALGEYLGDCGLDGTDNDYWDTIRYLYVRANNFIGMNIDEALRYFLTNGGFRLPGEAQKIDRIIETFSQCYFEDNAGDGKNCPFKDVDNIYLLSFAIIMLNTDLHKSLVGSKKRSKKMTKLDFMSNLESVQTMNENQKQYVALIYDSIQASPISVDERQDHDIISQKMADWTSKARSSDSLLRGLSVHNFQYKHIGNDSIEEDGNMLHLIRECFGDNWHYWHGAINTCLEVAHLDPQGMEQAIEILLYSWATCVILDLPTERTAFLKQLRRLKAFEEQRADHWINNPDDNSLRIKEWYYDLVDTSSGDDCQKFLALREVHQWTVNLGKALSTDVLNKNDMTKVVATLFDADYLLQDPCRSFVREGRLLKKSSRTGRTIEYRFLLFSDVLVYASLEREISLYRIHEELSLHLMKIVDWFPTLQKNRQRVFEVHHPQKTFQVICESSAERLSWVTDIRKAISMEIERKMKSDAARLACKI